MTFRFVPGYHEWHLEDGEGNLLVSVRDPLGYGDTLDGCETYGDVESLCQQIATEVLSDYGRGKDFYGFRADPAAIPTPYAERLPYAQWRKLGMTIIMRNFGPPMINR